MQYSIYLYVLLIDTPYAHLHYSYTFHMPILLTYITHRIPYAYIYYSYTIFHMPRYMTHRHSICLYILLTYITHTVVDVADLL